MTKRVSLRRLIIDTLALLAVTPIAVLHAENTTARQPNIVLIVADDMGYVDMGVTGVKDIRTPNLDRLAQGGTFLSNAYVTGPICVPSRMGIFMGRHQARWGIFTNNDG